MPGAIQSTAALARLQQVDREVPAYDVRTMRKLIDNEVVGLRYVAVLMGAFGALALMLSSVGVYAVMAFSVSERTQEIGLRMALGAGRRSVLAAVLRRGMAIRLAGMAIGLVMAFGLAKLLASLFFGISSTDPLTFAGFSLALAVVALAACYIPARRAAAVDPIRALRHE